MKKGKKMISGTKQGIVTQFKGWAKLISTNVWHRDFLRVMSLLFATSIIAAFQPETALAEQGVVPHPKGCADDEIYISSQDWWLTTPGEVGQDGQPGEDFGHLHTEMCFPHKATISGEMTLNVNSIMHNNPGDFYKLIIQIWAEGLPDLSGVCGEGSAVACHEFDPPRTLAT